MKCSAQLGRSSLRHDCWPVLMSWEDKSDSKASTTYISSSVGANGLYATAAVTMSADLKSKNIAVGLVHPGMLKTSFGGGTPPAKMVKMFKPVEGGAEGVVQALDALNMETMVRLNIPKSKSHFFSSSLCLSLLTLSEYSN